jgi:predicted metalloprotease
VPSHLPGARLGGAILLVATMLLAGCAVEQLDTDPLAGAQIDAKGRLDDSDASQLDARQVTDAALAAVDDFWARTFDAVYGLVYQPIQGGFFPYGPDSDPVPCGPDGGLLYSEIANNAFYCPDQDLIAWDEDALIAPLFDQFGGFTVGIVFAHEFGHAIQARAVSPRLPTIVLELQADCFAGAWTKDVEEGNSDTFSVTDDQLDASVAGFLQLRDGIGIEANDPNAHGTGFDRIGAFQDGLENGAEKCATYEDDFPEVFEFGFLSQADFESGGNLPFEQVTPATVEDLEAYWAETFAAQGDAWDPVDDVIAFDPAVDTVRCGDRVFDEQQAEFAAFYCVTDDTVLFDNANLMPELYRIGDFAMGFEIARQYSFAAQIRLGNDSNDREAELQADCFVGAYVASTIQGFGPARPQDPNVDRLLSSPGDLDEVIISFLAGADANESATAFERVAEFRRGVLGAGVLSVCEP